MKRKIGPCAKITQYGRTYDRDDSSLADLEWKKHAEAKDVVASYYSVIIRYF